ncbi:MAG: hypothetical protein ABSB19_06690 [Methylomonas sp.]|jgi:hypothetical protein
MGKSARLLAADPNKSEIAEDLLFKIGVLGRCDLCGETVIVKDVYDNMDKLAAVVQKTYPNALKSLFRDDPVLMKNCITDEYSDAAFQCENCNEKFNGE